MRAGTTQATDRPASTSTASWSDRAGRVPHGLAGLDDAPVELCRRRRRRCRRAADRRRPAPGRRADLMAHSRVLDALAATGRSCRCGSARCWTTRTAWSRSCSRRCTTTAATADGSAGRRQFNVRAHATTRPRCCRRSWPRTPRSPTQRAHAGPAGGRRARRPDPARRAVAQAMDGKRAHDAEWCSTWCCRTQWPTRCGKVAESTTCSTSRSSSGRVSRPIRGRRRGAGRGDARADPAAAGRARAALRLRRRVTGGSDHRPAHSAARSRAGHDRVAEQVRQQAEEEFYDPAQIREQLEPSTRREPRES